MSHRFPPLRPQVEMPRKATTRSGTAPSFTFADLCLMAAFVLSLALALI
jgi:hypothetical protein